MTCREYLPLINDLADGSLNGSAESKVKRHLSNCRDCSGDLIKTRKLKSILRTFNGPNQNRKYFNKATSIILNRIANLRKANQAIN
jgi:hypothetical protein